MDAPALVARKMREQRRRWLELDDPPRRALQIDRPAEETLFEFRSAGQDAVKALGMARDHVVDWRGFTEADLLGESVGSSDPVPFDRELFNEWARDDVGAITKALEMAFSLASEHAKAKGDVRKN